MEVGWGVAGTGDGVLLGDGLGDGDGGEGIGKFWAVGVGVGVVQLTTKSDNAITPAPVRTIAPSLIRVLIFITTFLTNLSSSTSNSFTLTPSTPNGRLRFNSASPLNLHNRSLLFLTVLEIIF